MYHFFAYCCLIFKLPRDFVYQGSKYNNKNNNNKHLYSAICKAAEGTFTHVANRWSLQDSSLSPIDEVLRTLHCNHDNCCVVRECVLDYCSRLCIAVVDLNSPRDAVWRIPRQSRYAVNCVEWNPHSSHADYFLAAVGLLLLSAQ